MYCLCVRGTKQTKISIVFEQVSAVILLLGSGRQHGRQKSNAGISYPWLLSYGMLSHDSARFLSDSPGRIELLVHLRTAPGRPSTITEELSMSHRSVQRNLSELRERGWVEKRDGVYQLTTTGALITKEHEAYLGALSNVEAFDGFFRELPDPEHAPDPEWLHEATLIEATSTDPHAPVDHYVHSVRGFDVDRVRMLSPVLSRLFHDAHAALAVRGTHTELVLSDALADRARELNPLEFDLLVSLAPLDLYRHPGPIGIGLTLGDRHVLVGAYDDHGRMCACVESTHPELFEWATTLYERYRTRSMRVESTRALSP